MKYFKLLNQIFSASFSKLEPKQAFFVVNSDKNEIK